MSKVTCSVLSVGGLSVSSLLCDVFSLRERIDVWHESWQPTPQSKPLALKHTKACFQSNFLINKALWTMNIVWLYNELLMFFCSKQLQIKVSKMQKCLSLLFFFYLDFTLSSNLTSPHIFKRDLNNVKNSVQIFKSAIKSDFNKKQT